MPQGNRRILVVDDDAPMREAFANGLGQLGYQCLTVGSAEDADRALQREEFALLLLDINMPGKSGLQFLTEITGRYHDMAIVMVTGLDELSTAVSAMREGASDYLTKPVPLSLLSFRVEQALSRRDLLLENRKYREQLEHMVDELNLRLEQNKRELAALNNLIQSRWSDEQETPEAYSRLESAVTAFGSGVESLAILARGIAIENSDPQSSSSAKSS